MRERNRFESEVADLESSSTHSLAAKARPTKKQYLFVASFDHEAYNHKLSGYCVNRIQRILGKTRGATTDPLISFTLFDVKEGKIKTFDVSGGKRVWNTVKTFTPVTGANYTGKKFTTNPAGIMSITDVYEHLRNIGKTDRFTVQELNFFGHGWHGGPILVNSKDTVSGPARDPNDKDGRASKDFRSPNMDATALSELGAAFSGDGFTWLWGCVFTAAPFQVLHRLFQNRLYQTGKLKDGDMVTLKGFSKAQAELFFEKTPSFFPVRRGDGTFALSFDRSFKEIKDLCQLMIDLSYCKSIAAATKRKCYGALPGTYSDFEKAVRLPLMLVPTKVPPYDDNFTAYLNFYKKHLGIALDPEGRGYGEHVP